MNRAAVDRRVVVPFADDVEDREIAVAERGPLDQEAAVTSIIEPS
jgi:hypothetical protein